LSSAGRPLRVIVADDDDELREVVCELVSGLQVEVEAAASGSDLGVLLSSDRTADLLITDVRMPWVTGLQVAAAVRNAGLFMPIIVITAFPDEAIRSTVDGLGSAVLLAKPFSKDDLLSLVQSQLPRAARC
jgi:CheY-like chemotaxis protein